MLAHRRDELSHRRRVQRSIGCSGLLSNLPARQKALVRPAGQSPLGTVQPRERRAGPMSLFHEIFRRMAVTCKAARVLYYVS